LPTVASQSGRARRSSNVTAEERIELELLRGSGLVSANGDRELVAKREPVERALAIWRASTAATSRG
jgi:hypothetical protein